MYKLATATYFKNTLKLDEIFNYVDGKKFKILIFEDENNNSTHFLEFIKNNKINVPVDFNFDREELYDR